MNSNIVRHRWLYVFILNVLMMTTTFAQGSGLDFLRSTGKIYSVIAVIVLIFLGIVLYLYRIDNKLTKLENQIKNE